MSDATDCGLRTDYRRPEGKPLDGVEFAREVIEGPRGMNSYEMHEMVIWHEHERVHAAEWMLKCLANINCEGSEEALASILEKRRRDTLAGREAAAAVAVRASWETDAPQAAWVADGRAEGGAIVMSDHARAPDIFGPGRMIESLTAVGLSYHQARDAVDALHCDHHNLWGTLEGNTAESDVRWFARQIYEETRREVFEPFKRFDDLDAYERSRWEGIATACLARLPFLMSRVANRCKAIADATKLVVLEPREEES